jgi:hypothetical protein
MEKIKAPVTALLNMFLMAPLSLKEKNPNKAFMLKKARDEVFSYTKKRVLYIKTRGFKENYKQINFLLKIYKEVNFMLNNLQMSKFHA